MMLDSHDLSAIIICAMATSIVMVSMVLDIPDTTPIITATLVLYGTVCGYIFGKGLSEARLNAKKEES